jgi:hypothetical protein
MLTGKIEQKSALDKMGMMRLKTPTVADRADELTGDLLPPV